MYIVTACWNMLMGLREYDLVKSQKMYLHTIFGFIWINSISQVSGSGAQ